MATRFFSVHKQVIESTFLIFLQDVIPSHSEHFGQMKRIKMANSYVIILVLV